MGWAIAHVGPPLDPPLVASNFYEKEDYTGKVL